MPFSVFFFGVGVIGLLIWGICARVELEKDASEIFFVAQYKAREEMTRSDRASHLQEQSLAHRSVRVFRHVGVGLTVIGFGGFLYGLGVSPT